MSDRVNEAAEQATPPTVRQLLDEDVCWCKERATAAVDVERLAEALSRVSWRPGGYAKADMYWPEKAKAVIVEYARLEQDRSAPAVQSPSKSRARGAASDGVAS